MRLKNKFFLDKIKNKVDFSKDYIIFLHLENNLFFKEFELFCLEKNIFFFKSQNSILKNFFKGKDGINSILKSSTFLIVLKDFQKVFDFLDFTSKFCLKNRSLILLGFYYYSKFYSIKSLEILKKFFRNKECNSRVFINSLRLLGSKSLKFLSKFMFMRLRLIRILKFNAYN